jgi:hypothetical protein
MSVTFSPAEDFNLPYRHVCSCGEYWGRTFPTFYEADKQLGFYKSHCRNQRCQADPMWVEALDRTPEVNVSNTNSVVILDALDIQQGVDFADRCFGTMTGQEFSDRILFARASSVSDAGLPAYQGTHPVLGSVINCGRPEGYLENILEELQEIADYAVAHNLTVSWG